MYISFLSISYLYQLFLSAIYIIISYLYLSIYQISIPDIHLSAINIICLSNMYISESAIYLLDIYYLYQLSILLYQLELSILSVGSVRIILDRAQNLLKHNPCSTQISKLILKGSVWLDMVVELRMQ